MISIKYKFINLESKAKKKSQNVGMMKSFSVLKIKIFG